MIDEYDMEDFKQEWMKIDKKGEGVIRVTSLRPLLMQVGTPARGYRDGLRVDASENPQCGLVCVVSVGTTLPHWKESV